jgi:hypothetical protein
VKSTEARKPDSIPTFGRIDRKEKGALLAEARNRSIADTAPWNRLQIHSL